MVSVLMYLMGIVKWELKEPRGNLRKTLIHLLVNITSIICNNL